MAPPSNASRVTECRVKMEELGDVQIGDQNTIEDTHNNDVRTSSNQMHKQEDNTRLPPRRSARNRIQYDPQSMPSGAREMNELNRLTEEDEEENNFTLCMLADTSISMEEAMTGPEAGEWQDTIQKEELGVIIKENCPIGANPLKTRYVLTQKCAPDGTVQKCKARRVVQGFHQIPGRDFFEASSPVVGFNTIRLVLKLMIERGWDMRTIDFTQAYLNTPIQETIHVKNEDGSTGRLNKALCGLKQAVLEWNRTLKERILKRKICEQSEFDNCLYYAIDETFTKNRYQAVYVGDLLITRSWIEEMKLMHVANGEAI